MNYSFFFSENSLVCYITEFISIEDIMKIKYNKDNKEIYFDISNNIHIIPVNFSLNLFEEFVIFFSKTPEIFYFLKHNNKFVDNPENSIKNF